MPHYYDADSPLNPYKITVAARGEEAEIWTGSGVFSRDKLDKATKLLIDSCIMEDGWDVLDLGCGNGVVSILLGKAYPNASFLATDVAQNALKVAKMNARGRTFKVRKSDCYEKIPETFDTILVNPPYVAGRKVVFSMLDGAKEHLKPGGLLQVVARHQKGGKMIKEKLMELFGNCDDSRKKGGFRVYICAKT
ncbi:MAG: methyltransferase [Candidatus Woesearchaeota archaeon]|nr:methyltransferase [Candidatus Woesearchaeota archaeon]